jgi:DNA polymerase III alpha subunit
LLGDGSDEVHERDIMSDKKINRFDYTGKLTRVDTFTSKSGKPIVTLVFQDEDGQWPKWIAVKAFSRLADQAADWKPGDILEISGHLSGREYNGKIYTENIADVVDVMSGADPLASEAQAELPTDANGKPLDDDSGETPF